MNNTALSEVSQGGITSKRSHHYVLDSASNPIQSKQPEQTDDEEPVDPMFEDYSGVGGGPNDRG